MANPADFLEAPTPSSSEEALRDPGGRLPAPPPALRARGPSPFFFFPFISRISPPRSLGGRRGALHEASVAGGGEEPRLPLGTRRHRPQPSALGLAWGERPCLWTRLRGSNEAGMRLRTPPCGHHLALFSLLSAKPLTKPFPSGSTKRARSPAGSGPAGAIPAIGGEEAKSEGRAAPRRCSELMLRAAGGCGLPGNATAPRLEQGALTSAASPLLKGLHVNF